MRQRVRVLTGILRSYDERWETAKTGTGETTPKQLLAKSPGAPKDRFVFGKIHFTSDGGSGPNNFIDMSTLRTEMCKARSSYGYTGGLMLWRHHEDKPDECYKNYKMLSAPCGELTTCVFLLTCTPRWGITVASDSDAIRTR